MLIDPQMLFTWDTNNLCIVFRWWHIRSTPGLIISLLTVVALGAAYEALRAVSRRYETFVNKRQEELPSKHIFPPLPSPRLNLVFSTTFILYCIIVSYGMKLRDVCVETELLLRERLSFGQGATRSKLARGRMLSRRFCMQCRTFMRLC
jgi:hypothetical protein